MRINENTVLTATIPSKPPHSTPLAQDTKPAPPHTTLALIPYLPTHVPIYHEWMQSPEIQAMTASEPLTLEEEYEMQLRWRDDGDKLTFIVGLQGEGEGNEESEVESEGKGKEECDKEENKQSDENGGGKLIGDVNLFISTRESESESESESDSKPSAAENDASTATPEVLVGELELMIAVPSEQRRGYGRTAILMLMRYIIEHEAEIVGEYLASRSGNLDQRGGGEQREGDAGQDGNGQKRAFEYFEVKIHESNERSIRLFEGIGFERVREEGNYFGELEFRMGRERRFLVGKGIGDGVEGVTGRWSVGGYQEGRYEGAA